MKQIPKNNRNRQRSGRRQGGGGGGNNGHNLNRVYESAGPEGKVRGTAQQIIDKYSTLARDAMTSGDRIVAENFFQHAEHYQRIVAAALVAEAMILLKATVPSKAMDRLKAKTVPIRRKAL